jgi:hypothetical protein
MPVYVLFLPEDLGTSLSLLASLQPLLLLGALSSGQAL